MPDTDPQRPIDTPWLTEPEAAEYARCSVWGFRRMGLRARNSGGRKVYNKKDIDSAIEARLCMRGTRGRQPYTPSPEMRRINEKAAARKERVRLGLVKPRKVRTSIDNKSGL